MKRHRQRLRTLAQRSRRLATAARHRAVQPRRRAAKDCLALRKRPMGHSLRPHSDDAHPEAADRPFRRACGERARLPHAGASLGLPAPARVSCGSARKSPSSSNVTTASQAGNDIIRVHQEDICQALGIMPTKKYQNEGGPNAAEIVELLRTYSTRSSSRYRHLYRRPWLQLAYRWHRCARQELLAAAGRPSRPACATLRRCEHPAPYDEFDLSEGQTLDENRRRIPLRDVGLRQWQKFASEMRVDAEKLIEELIAMSKQLHDEVNAVRARASKKGCDRSHH